MTFINLTSGLYNLAVTKSNPELLPPIRVIHNWIYYNKKAVANLSGPVCPQLKKTITSKS